MNLQRVVVVLERTWDVQVSVVRVRLKRQRAQLSKLRIRNTF